MHVLFLDQFSELGGAQHCLLDLIPAVRARGWEAHVAGPPGGPLEEECRSRGATFDAIRCGPYLRGRKSPADVLRFAVGLPGLRKDLVRLAERHQAGLIYVNGPRLLPAVSRAARSGVPVLFHCHSLLRQRYAAWLAGRSLRSSNATVVASCRFVAQPLNRFVGLSRLYVVYNGVRESPYRREEIAEGGEWRIGVIGRIAPEKGQAEFLEAARLLLKFRQDCRFVICGDALSSDRTTAKYARKVRELSAGLPVEFTGWREDVYAVLRELDLLVVPSAPGEATTRVILEAYAAGVPVVATASGGIPEVLNNGETGYLVERFAPYAIANRMHAFLTTPRGERQEFSENARAAWRKRYSLERWRRRMVEIMEEAA
jgi:glycosyltransferase involved in cell wall biosynthesis